MLSDVGACPLLSGQSRPDRPKRGICKLARRRSGIRDRVAFPTHSQHPLTCFLIRYPYLWSGIWTCTLATHSLFSFHLVLHFWLGYERDPPSHCPARAFQKAQTQKDLFKLAWRGSSLPSPRPNQAHELSTNCFNTLLALTGLEPSDLVFGRLPLVYPKLAISFLPHIHYSN